MKNVHKRINDFNLVSSILTLYYLRGMFPPYKFAKCNERSSLRLYIIQLKQIVSQLKKNCIYIIINLYYIIYFYRILSVFI